MRVVDLFSGCGGMSAGFEKAHFDIQLAIELWEPARTVYQNNFDHPVLGFDLSGVNEAIKLVRKQKADLIMGGPPCQDFSVAGKRVEGDKAGLTIDFCEIVSEVQPRWFVLENVPGIQSSVAWEFGRWPLLQAASNHRHRNWSVPLPHSNLPDLCGPPRGMRGDENEGFSPGWLVPCETISDPLHLTASGIRGDF